MTDMGLFAHYQALEERYTVANSSDYETLVVPNGNSSTPFHRWFHLKEGYSCNLLNHVLQDAGLAEHRHLSVLDPFCGGGTTIVSALELARSGKYDSIEACGIERNPFIKLVAEAKSQALIYGSPEFSNFVEQVVNLVETGAVVPGPVPQLSTFSNPDYFEPHALSTLLELKTAIETVEGPTLARNLALVCLAGAVEPVSGLRRDGRALRYEGNKLRVCAIDEFLRRSRILEHDLAKGTVQARASIYLGDGRMAHEAVPADFKANLVLYSPPYPNNIDYTEVYKLEAWLLSYIKNQEEFRSQRLITVRSHPSVRFPEIFDDGLSSILDDLLGPLLAAIPKNKHQRWRRNVIRGYFDDMAKVFINVQHNLAYGGKVVYVVGNSLHGSNEETFLIATDLIMARIAEATGLAVDNIIVARQPNRRKSTPFLRESVVFLSKQ